MEPRPSCAEFTVLPRAVPASSLWAPEPGTVHNALIRSVTTANIHGGRVNDLQRRAGEGDRLRWGAPRPATGRGQERHADARPQSRAASQASPLGKPGRSVLPGGEHPQGGGRRHPGAPGLAEGAPACRRKAEIHNIDGSGPGGEGWRDLVPLEKRSWAGWGGVCFRETL